MTLMKEMMVAQGYVPKECLLEGGLIWVLIKEGKDPCEGCNYDRRICKGGFDATQ